MNIVSQYDIRFWMVGGDYLWCHQDSVCEKIMIGLSSRQEWVRTRGQRKKTLKFLECAPCKNKDLRSYATCSVWKLNNKVEVFPYLNILILV